MVKLRRFQVHLSTLMAMSVAAGGMIWLNTIKHKIGLIGTDNDFQNGFPFSFYFYPAYQENLSWVVGPFEYKPFVLDLWLAGSVVVTAGFVVEVVARRRSLARLLAGTFAVVAFSLSVFLFLLFLLGWGGRIGHFSPK